MKAEARALKARVDERLAVVEAALVAFGEEQAQLWELQESLQALIESPGRAGSPPAGPARAEQPARVAPPGDASPAADFVTCDDCKAKVKRRGIGTHRRLAHGVQRAKARTTTGRTTTPAKPDGKAMCPTCSDWFVSAERLAQHRAKDHGYRGPSGESYLCDRCSESFQTREARDAHAAMHPEQPRGQPVGRDPLTQRRLGTTGTQLA